MKRKLIICLFAFVMVLTLAVCGVIYLSAYFNSQTIIRKVVDQSHDHLVKKFKTFDFMVGKLEKQVDERIGKTLPRLAMELTGLNQEPAELSLRDLRAITEKYDFDDIYLIDRNGVVVNTTFQTDLGLNLSSMSRAMEKSMREIRGQGKVLIDRVGFSSKTGIIRKYAYLGPKNTNFIVEVSINFRDYVARTTSDRYRDFIFHDLIKDSTGAGIYITNLDLFTYNRIGQWSLINEGKSMDPKVAGQLLSKDRVEVWEGSRLTVYSNFDLADSRIHLQDSGTCTMVVYDFGVLSQLPEIILKRSLLVILCLTLAASCFFSRFLNRYIVQRILKIKNGLKRVAESNHSRKVDIPGQDELSDIAYHINMMHDSILFRENQLLEAKHELEQQVNECLITETILYDSEKRFRLLFENSPVSLWELDLSELKEELDRIYERTRPNLMDYLKRHPEELTGLMRSIKILDANKATLHLFEADSIRQLVDDFTLLFNSDTYDDFTELLEQLAKGNLPGFDGDCRSLKGREISIVLSSSLPEGSWNRTLISILDVTDLKKAEREKGELELELARARKMEAIGTLAGGIAHDFNNLLMAIEGNVSIMQFGMDPGHPFVQRLRGIEESVISGAKLTSQLLGYARKGQYEVRPIRVNALVNDVCETFGRARKDINIVRNLATDLKTIEADRSQIEQILLHLFINAGDAMPGSGNLTIETRNTNHERLVDLMGILPAGDFVWISIADTGVGMDEEVMERIFDPFFTTKPMGKGTGLGLASAYGIVKAHKGHIQVESQKGIGTTFHLFFPASEKTIATKPAQPESPAQGIETILLVDDEEEILEVGLEILTLLGYKAIGANGGREALDKYQALGDSIDLIILDMVMPDISGGDTFDLIKKINPGVRVLLSSGYSAEGQAEKIIKRGCDGFIQKPFNIKELSDKIRGILDRAEAGRAA